jgi:hypothetical protein
VRESRQGGPALWPTTVREVMTTSSRRGRSHGREGLSRVRRTGREAGASKTGATGLEPATSGVTGRRSATWKSDDPFLARRVERWRTRSLLIYRRASGTSLDANPSPELVPRSTAQLLPFHERRVCRCFRFSRCPRGPSTTSLSRRCSTVSTAATKNRPFAGGLASKEPSDGLEPSTPSLPWRIRASATRPMNSAC